MLNKNYIFVHLPKTAGSTLKSAVEAAFAREDIVWDYHQPFAQGHLRRNAKNTITSYSTGAIQGKLVFGHFLPCKYCDLSLKGFSKRADSVYLTFLRDPLQRAISHYYFWKRDPDLENRACVKFLEEDWDLEKFLTAPFYQNFYAQYFFGFNINKFDFIGITECFEDSIKLLKKEYPEFSSLDPNQRLNINSEKTTDENYVIDPYLASIFIRNNALDYRIYEKGKANLNLKLHLEDAINMEKQT